MNIEYKTIKNLPCLELYELFKQVGWAQEDTTTDKMLKNFNIGFLNSTFVISAWSENHLIGCARVLSDTRFRSVIYDVAVLPEFQKMGIGKTMIKRCFSEFPDSEFLVQTDKRKDFYMKLGLQTSSDDFLIKPGKWF